MNWSKVFLKSVILCCLVSSYFSNSIILQFTAFLQRLTIIFLLQDGLVQATTDPPPYSETFDLQWIFTRWRNWWYFNTIYKLTTKNRCLCLDVKFYPVNSYILFNRRYSRIGLCCKFYSILTYSLNDVSYFHWCFWNNLGNQVTSK